MTTLPHDISDLYLAPVALAIDKRIQHLATMSPAELRNEIALVSDRPDDARDLREAGLLSAVTHFIDTHHWEVEWDPRGLRVHHDGHSLVLGVPTTFTDFLTGA